MLLIYNNKGILIPVYFFVSIFLAFIINSIFYEFILKFTSIIKYDHQIVFGVGFLIAFIWSYLTSYDSRLVNGIKERIEMNNHFFYVSNRLWSYIFLVSGILTIISGVLETIQ